MSRWHRKVPRPKFDDTEYLTSLPEPPPDDVLKMWPSTAVTNVRNQVQLL